jgi:two-component system, OmpR family, phosphate regulon sensor histidine kinase PhoR
MTFAEFPTSERTVADLSASNTILQSILDTAREAVLVLDKSMRIKASNRAASDAFARGNGTLDDRRLSEVIRDMKLHEAFRVSIDRRQPSDIKLEIAGGEKRSYDIHIAPFELEGRRHAIGFFYDVTQIERLEKVRQEFLSNISHELRTPLTSIMAFVETLEDGAIDDKENNRRFLSVIHRNAERMHSLIADILELSLIESGNISIEKGQVRLAHLIDDIFDSLSSKAAERDILLTHDVSADVRVAADPGRLEQMLTNLIDNAIKFNRPAGNVEVGAVLGDRYNIISVADTGEGIIAEHLQRIFERFYRLDRGRTREVGGTGLGLAIVKHLARLHGGEVSVESELGRGTTFFIELPVQ